MARIGKKTKSPALAVLPISIGLGGAVLVTHFLCFVGHKSYAIWGATSQSERSRIADFVLQSGAIYSVVQAAVVLVLSLLSVSSLKKALMLTFVLWLFFLAGIAYAAFYSYNYSPAKVTQIASYAR